MTTDAADDRAARLATLRQRRGQIDGAPSAGGQRPTTSRTPRRQRRHPALRARIIAASLSGATAVALMGVMAETSADTAAPAPQIAPTTAVSHPPAAAASPQPTRATAPAVTAATAPAVTSSHAS